MGDLSTIIDMLKDFSKFGKNIVDLFRGIPDLFIDLGKLPSRATDFENAPKVPTE
ncbi:hypothetical protein [uncultured Corynebacterium sp.]|uniref:hypothetical protein n=1 Tax=uncultured Corynebacterium sp. TaxID=159447 RepID=UPI00260BE5CE|nr:hypothetical protein [uncultured Corynebacterium sp.]